MTASNYLEVKVLNHTFRQAAFTQPSALYVALHSADPGETGASELTTAGGYKRKAASGSFGTTASGTPTSILNDAAVTFGAATGDWNGGATIGYYSIWDSGPAPASGNCLQINPITSPIAVTSGATASFAIGAIKIKCE